ncbi:MAG: tRNA(Ile)-lysidine synthase [Gemmatimonadetes bacterium]|nr:tRNA(Ile)-lysidine synthase [Gemmatimonadota bacterium]
MHHDSARAVRQASRRAARSADAPLLLAVSGGLDSMALLAAMGEVAHGRIAAVATFDHGTGAAGVRAAAHVASVAGRMGLPCIVGHASGDSATPDGLEAAWRRARHDFLRTTARTLGARIVTAHTADDQIETVLMRLMRGSGTRGLAGLLAPSVILRPFVTLRRAVLEQFARAAQLEWREDPSNLSRAHARNRVRHDLLPALRRVRPRIDTLLLQVGREASVWRTDVEQFLDAAVTHEVLGSGGVSVAAGELAGYDRDSLSILWSALAGRAGLALDRRGTRRLAEFTMAAPGDGSKPLAAGWCMEARRQRYVLGRTSARAEPVTLPVEGSVEWGRFRFVVSADDCPDSSWKAMLPVAAVSTVRAWGAGDRLAPAGAQPRRRVKRYLSDAGLRGSERCDWPVVVAGDDVVWIPGVRRSDAATERSGRPVRHYVCERIDR